MDDIFHAFAYQLYYTGLSLNHGAHDTGGSRYVGVVVDVMVANGEAGVEILEGSTFCTPVDPCVIICLIVMIEFIT